jgi:serine/threonine protein kinase
MAQVASFFYFDIEQYQNKLFKLAWNVSHTSQIKNVKQNIEKNNYEYFDKFKKDNNVSTLGTYVIIKPLGSGGFSTVNLCFDTVNNKYVAIRNINKKYRKKKKNINNIENIRIIAKNDPDDLLGCSKPLAFIDNTFMVMNAHGPSLGHRIQNHGPLSEKEALLFIVRAAHTLYWLETVCELSHGDISPFNFVFNSPLDYPYNVANIRLIDFDSLQHPEHIEENQFGTFIYASPENNNGKPYQYRANDAYAFGKTIYYCITGERNYSSKNKHMYSSTINKILISLLHYDPNKRATYDVIISHALFGLRKLS